MQTGLKNVDLLGKFRAICVTNANKTLIAFLQYNPPQFFSYKYPNPIMDLEYEEDLNLREGHAVTPKTDSFIKTPSKRSV